MSAPYWSVLVAGAYSTPDTAPLDGDPSRQHAPTDRSQLRAAALELAAQGLKPADISEALRLPESVVRDLLDVPT